MKKLLALVIATMFSVSSIGMVTYADDEVKLIINGTAVDFSGDQEPVIQNGNTLVPFRTTFEKMGAEVKWFPDIRLCEAEYGGITVGITIGDTKVIIGEGAELESDVPAQIINGRTMVPLRVLSESIGAEVSWDNATRTITVTTPEILGEAPESVQYVTKSGVAGGKVYVNYEYPVITDRYTAADLLNKNIADDIANAVAEIAATAESEKTELNIVYDVRYNLGGVFSVMYLIDGEAVYWNNYGIINGARISDEEYHMITGGDLVLDENEVYTIANYEVSKNGSDGYACITAEVYYPQFAGNNDFIESLNTLLENSAKKAADSFIESYEEDAVKIYDNPPQHLFEVPYSFIENCNVEITDDNTAVITTEFSEIKYNDDIRTGSDTIKINLNTGEVVE